MFKRLAVIPLLVGAVFLAALLAFWAPNPGEAAKVGGGDITYKDVKGTYKGVKAEKPVLFSHASHQKAGEKCTPCHVKVFKLKKGSAKKTGKFNMVSMEAGKFCGSCHNGKKSFSVKVKASCNKCHK